MQLIFLRYPHSKNAVQQLVSARHRKPRHCFEDNAKGLLDNANYEVMMGEYQAEQADLSAKLAGIRSRLAEKADYAEQLEKLQAAVRECSNITELTPLILNKLIDRIKVGSQEVVERQKQQQVTLVWRFAGEVCMLTLPPHMGRREELI